MKRSLLLLTLLAPFAWSAVRMDITFKSDDMEKKMSILTKAGNSAILTEIDNESREGFEIIATPKLLPGKSQGPQSIEVEFQVSEIKNDKRHLLGRPRVITRVGDTASLTQTNDSGETFRLSVRPTFQ